MSTTIDERVVEMRFDNKNFENNVQTTLSTLDKLKQSLKLSGASKGLENIGEVTKKVNLSPISNAVETVRVKFSALEVMAVTALANITNSAVNAGKKIISALTIDPIKTGFSEYETKMGSIQTIMSNTASKGETIESVTRVIDELNTYADKTIYNFAEMTRNIGTFTAAGVGLKESASAIQGIANLAAASGSTSQQASTAMYQLSQALAAGTVKLMDWNSVVNAGMGGEKFQEALKATAREHGVAVDALIKKNGSFRESLQEGWISADILNETLNKFTVDGATNYAESMMKSGKWTQEQADALIAEAQAMEDAATKVKTFTQLWDTLKESTQSGWGKTWEIIVGDFVEAQDLFTNVSDTLGGYINTMSDARNELLTGALSSGWKQLLGEGIADAEGFKEVVKTVGKEYGYNVDQLIKDTGSFEKSLREGWATSDVLTESISRFAAEMGGLSEKELEARGYTQEHVKSILELDEAVKNGSISMEEFSQRITRLSGREHIIQAISNIFDGLLAVLKPVKDAFSDVFEPLTDSGLYNGILEFEKLTEKFKISEETADKLKRTFSGLFSILDIGVKILTSVGNGFAKLLGSDGISGLGSALLDVTASLGDFFTSLNKSFDASGISGFLSSIVDGISNLIESAVGPISNFGDIISAAGNLIVGVANKIWDVVRPVFTWVRENISAGDIFAGLAGGGIFVAAKKLSGFLDGIIETIQNLFKGDNKALSSFRDILNSVHESLNAFATGIKISSLVSIALAIGVLSASLKTISEINAGNIIKSLSAIAAMMVGLSLTMKSVTNTLSKNGSKGLINASVSLILIAEALNILANAMQEMTSLSLKDIGKSLVGVGGGLLAMTGALKLIGKTKTSLKTSIAIIALAKSCDILANALIKFGSMSWSEIGRGLSAMGGALLEVGTISGALGKIAGFSGLLGSGAIIMIIQGLDDLANALIKFGSMSWSEIGRGLSAMGGALLEVGAISGALGMIAGFSGLLGSGAILLTIQGLDDLANALIKFGTISWDQIKSGLTAMGLALLEVGAISGALGMIAGFSGLLGSGAIFLVVQGLDDLANALIKFGSMSWSEIGRGLSAMRGALGETAIGGLLNSLSFLGGFSISTIAEPLGVLADSVKKWSDVTVPEGLGIQLAILAAGVKEFTFAGLGSGALSESAEAVGILADSVKKWQGVTVPEGLSDNMKKLADGVEKFWAAGLGSGALSESAEAVGILADSVKKWKDVQVPDNLDDNLKGIADGVKAFSFAFVGGWSISSLITPLSELPESIKKWSDVAVPANIESDLTNIANGVKAFSSAYEGGWSIDAIVEPLGQLPDAINKWKEVTVSDDIGNKLSLISTGISSMIDLDYVIATDGVNSLTTALSNLATNVSPIMVETASSMTTTLITEINSYHSQFMSAGMYLVDGFANGITANTWKAAAKARAMAEAAKNAAKAELDEHSPSKEFYNIGDFAGLGFVNALDSYADKAYKAGAIMARSTVDGAKDELRIKSPSKEFEEEVGAMIGPGLARGIIKRSNEPVDAASEMASQIVAASKKKFEDFEKWLDSMKYYNTLSSSEELYAWQQIQARYKNGTEARQKADKEVYRLQNELQQDNYNKFLEWLDKKKEASEISTEDEIYALEQLRAVYSDNTDEAIAIDERLFNAREALRKEDYQKSVEWIEKQKSLFAKLSGSKRVQLRNDAKSEEYSEMGNDAESYIEDIKDASNTFFKGREDALKEHNAAMEALQDDYVEGCKDINDQLIDDIQDLEDAYDDAVKSRTDTLYRSYGLFDWVDSAERMDGSDLIENLQSQVNALDEWQTDINKLRDRGIDDELLGELQEMGPSAATQIKALTNMSDTALDKYVSLWEEKNEIAHTQAVTELEGLREDTDAQILQLQYDADEALDELNKVWRKSQNELIEQTNEQLDELRRDYLISLGLMSDDVNHALTDMVLEAVTIIGDKTQWSEASGNIIAGMVEGLVEHSSEVNDTIEQVVKDMIAIAKATAGIASPAKKFIEIGKYSDQGLAIGLLKFAGKVTDAASSVGYTAMDALRNAISIIPDIINSDMDFEPTIRPVIDMSNIQNGMDFINDMFGYSSYKLASVNSVGINSAISAQMQRADYSNNAKVVDAITNLRGDFASLVDAIGNMQITMDGKTVVGRLIGKIDSGLGQIANHRGRGN